MLSKDQSLITSRPEMTVTFVVYVTSCLISLKKNYHMALVVYAEKHGRPLSK